MKYILLPAFILSSFLLKAQFTRGDKFIGGSFSISAGRSTDNMNSSAVTKNTSFSLNPSIGFFLNDKWAVGGSIGCSSQRQKDSYNGNIQTNKSRSFNTGLFARRYFGITDKFFFVVEGRVYYGRGKDNYHNGISETTTKSYSLGTNISPRFVFFPSPKWGIEAGIGSLYFNHYKNLTADRTSNNVGLDYGSFWLGFAYYIRQSE